MSRSEILPVIPIKVPVALPNVELRIEVGRTITKNAVTASEINFNNEILLIFQKENFDKELSISLNDCYTIGLLAKFENKIKLSNSNFKIRFQPFERVNIDSLSFIDGYYQAKYTILNNVYGDIDEEKLYISKISSQVLEKGASFLKNTKAVLEVVNKDSDASVFADTVASNLLIKDAELYKYLENLVVNDRLSNILKDIELIFYHKELDDEIEAKVRKSMEQSQKEYYLREKIKAIQEDLGDVDNASADVEKLREKIKEAKMPKEVEEHVLKELRRYQSVSSANPESNMIRQYLDTMLELPWFEETEDIKNIGEAKAKLDGTHFGLDKVKDRILEYLSVKLYTNVNPQTILCFVGPPGVGKTTLAESIANALGRKFVKQSLGGLKDEAEIRGHRRTYIGALPGRIINGMRQAKVTNPVFLLDEIDKVGADYKGDPAAALLEVLDPEQNKRFADHYIEDNYDLSKVMFICTANNLEDIPRPLFDRMEVIELNSYTEIEKFNIARTHLIDRELKLNGLDKEKFEITDNALKDVIKHYTRESGVRNLQRFIGTLIRKSIRKILSENLDKVVVDENNLTEMLGKFVFTNNESLDKDYVGVVTGLAWTPFGGDTLQIEVTSYPGKGALILTGKLGDVMKESANIAYSWAKTHAKEYGIEKEVFEKNDIHIHVPEGATPKDGPSAGVTLTTALISHLTNRLVDHTIGMTGEVTLTGRVLPIGGLREKSIAALRSGLKTILIPSENLRDLEDIPVEVKEKLEILPMSTVEEVLNKALK